MAIVPCAGDPPPPAAIEQAAAALTAGQPVVIPTDTVYGIAVDPVRPAAAERLFAIKERPTEAALPVLVAGVDQALELAGELPAPARRLMERCWPGGVTLVVPRRGGLGLDLGGADDRTIGLRMPDHPVPVALATRVGPLAATSANRHGRPTPATATAVADELGGAVELVLDGGPCEGRASTVVSCTAEGVHILRQGRVPADQIVALAR